MSQPVPASETLWLLFPLPVVLFSWLLKSSFLVILWMKLVHHWVFLVPVWKQCLLPESLIIMSPVKAPTQYPSLSEMILVISFFSFPNLNGLHRWIFLSHPLLHLSYLEQGPLKKTFKVFNFYFLLKYSWFTMFQVHSKVIINDTS